MMESLKTNAVVVSKINAETHEAIRQMLAEKKARGDTQLASLVQEAVSASPSVAIAGQVQRVRFHSYTSGEFDEFPEVEFAIDGVFPVRGVTALFGASQVGKSALVLEVMRAMVTGATWFGRETLKCSVWVVSLEGQGGLRNRVRAMERHFQQKLPDSARFVFDQINLMVEEDVDELKRRIVQHGGVRVVVIDTLACAMSGGDENSFKDMSKLLSAAKDLQRAIDGLVILVHHTGKDASRGLRGHSSLLAALDVAIEVKRHENYRSWRLVKARDAEDGVSGAFLLQKVELQPDSKGNPRNSVVVVQTEMPEEQDKPREPAYKHQRTVLGLLKVHLVEIEAMQEEGSASIGFDHAVEMVKDSLDVGPKHQKLRAQEAIRGLIKAGFIVEQGDAISLPPSDEEG
ncbi:MAG: AAA family ATPase [Hydrogenophaga sp.]|nr:AAA family ATPase [Hydrogenophaga sp.]